MSSPRSSQWLHTTVGAVRERMEKRLADAYLVTDAGGNLREANRAATQLFGAARDELVGKPLAGFMAEQDRGSFLSHIMGSVLGEPMHPATWRAGIRARGKPLAAIISVRAIPLRRSGVAGLCWLIRPA